MRYPILIQRRDDGLYHAAVLVMPTITRVGTTRDEALEAIQHALTEALQSTEVVYLEVPPAQNGSGNPWLETAGLFADDPDLEPMLRDISAARDSE